MTDHYLAQVTDQRDKARAALKSAEDELRQRRQADARIRAQHHVYRSVYDEGDARSCAHCNQLTSYAVPWPCPTIQALNGTDTTPDTTGQRWTELPP